MIVNRLIVLDFYRGLAAFLVMMYHFQESFNSEVLKGIKNYTQLLF
jgi:peptidoglycan/LPS O-acetylase OafA/YrhL